MFCFLSLRIFCGLYSINFAMYIFILRILPYFNSTYSEQTSLGFYCTSLLLILYLMYYVYFTINQTIMTYTYIFILFLARSFFLFYEDYCSWSIEVINYFVLLFSSVLENG